MGTFKPAWTWDWGMVLRTLPEKVLKKDTLGRGQCCRNDCVPKVDLRNCKCFGFACWLILRPETIDRKSRFLKSCVHYTKSLGLFFFLEGKTEEEEGQMGSKELQIAVLARHCALLKEFKLRSSVIRFEFTKST